MTVEPFALIIPLNSKLKKMTTKKIKLKRIDGGWQFQDIKIIKREWILPFASSSYQATIDGAEIETDTLAEMRDYISEWID